MKAVLSELYLLSRLPACVYVPTEYKAGPVQGDPKKIVERCVMYEQPEQTAGIPSMLLMTMRNSEPAVKASSRETLTGFEPFVQEGRNEALLSNDGRRKAVRSCFVEGSLIHSRAAHRARTKASLTCTWRIRKMQRALLTH